MVLKVSMNWADEVEEERPQKCVKGERFSRLPQVGDEITLADGDGRYRVVRVNSTALRCQVIDLLNPGRKQWVSCNRVN